MSTAPVREGDEITPLEMTPDIDHVRAYFGDGAPQTFFFNDEAAKRLAPYAALFRVPDGAPITDVSDPVYKARKEVIRRLPFWATQLLAKAKARMLTGTG